MYSGQKKIQGVACSSGITSGRIYILKDRYENIPSYSIPEEKVKKEIARFREAVRASVRQLEGLQKRFGGFNMEHGQILESHRMLLKDETLQNQVEQLIGKLLCNAEGALFSVFEAWRSALTLQERRDDLRAVYYRILKSLMGKDENPWSEIPKGKWIAVAKELTPAEVILLPRDRVVGFCTETGSSTSHTLITARSLDIPALVGMGSMAHNITQGISSILDGYEGQLILDATHRQERKYRDLSKKHQILEGLLLQENRLPSVTPDGHKVSLMANIEFLEELPILLKHGAEGIGLFRTEQLYLGRQDIPSEEEQFRVYKTLLQKMKNKPVTIRLFDLPGEEWMAQMTSNPLDGQINSTFGMRGIRFALQQSQLLKTQIRALLRASAYGNLKILIPFVSGLEELLAVRQLVRELRTELRRKKHPVKSYIPVGVMIEVPSAALIADSLAKECDFFAVGSNDLLQYVLAMDRSNESVASMCTPLHPAILRFLKAVCVAAQHAQIEISICGEMAGDPQYIPLLLGLPIQALSMNALMIPKMRKIIRSIKKQEAREQFSQLLKLEKQRQIEAKYRLWVRKAVGKNPLDTTPFS